MAIIFGCNAGVFDLVNAAVPGSVGCRSYRDAVNDIPAAWPGAPGSKSVVSLRPHPDDLLSGHLDDRIRALLAVADPDAMLTVWHEAGTLRYPEFITPATVRQMHVKMQRLCSDTQVAYGCILCGPPDKQEIWVPRRPHALDWYGVDVYMSAVTTTAEGTVDVPRLRHHMDAFRHLAQERSGKHRPRIVVPETNALHRAARPRWFRALAEWMAGNGGERMLTFWKEGGTSGGPWLPEDADTIRTLKELKAIHG
jgi:hypothetical protein